VIQGPITADPSSHALITSHCVLPPFCDRDLEITLKLEGDREILKMYSHTENEAASLRHSKLRS